MVYPELSRRVRRVRRVDPHASRSEAQDDNKMRITAVKTRRVELTDRDLFGLLSESIKNLEENAVVAVTSKIVAITEGRIVRIGNVSKEEKAPNVSKEDRKEVELKQKNDLISGEAERFIPSNKNKYGVSLTIKNNILAANAGIDESNANGYYILWPENPHKSANAIRKFLREKFSLKNLGVILTDSKTTPLRWGVTGIALGYSGFAPLKSYVGTPDLFGREFAFEKMHIADSLAAAATVVMGEGSEQTPIAVIDDLPFVTFQENDPTEEEIKNLKINLEDDLYGQLLTSVAWEKGEK